jgi:GNAT superfamily N-acetyltransferase
MQENYLIVRSELELANNCPKQKIVEFLHQNLEQFRDPPDQIEAAIDYAFSDAEGKGGFVVLQEMNGNLTGAVVMNKTGMSGYIPENILVYVAVDGSQRGQGLGSRLIRRALDVVEGDVALHVEYDNPAKRLYERLGFVSKYAEMRYVKKGN